jgi:hypothetical protein
MPRLFSLLFVVMIADTPALADEWPAKARMQMAAAGARLNAAAMRADAVLEAGDLDGYGVWKGMLKAVEELLRAVPGEGERVN